MNELSTLSWQRYFSIMLKSAEFELIWLLSAFVIGFLLLRREHGSFAAVFQSSKKWISQKLFWTELARDAAWVFFGTFVVLLLTTYVSAYSYGNGAGHHGGIPGTIASLNWRGPDRGQIALTGIWWQYVFVLLLVIGGDFGKFWIHRLMHRNDFLWRFHRVHHESVYLTPLSVNRSHPVMIFLFRWAMSIGGSLVGIPILYFFSFPVQPEKLQLFLTVLLSFYLATIHLQHSHIWLSYGKVLDRVFVSPATHQIHHSQDPAHHNKNFGFIFSFWDALYASARFPDKKEKLVFGLPKENPYS